MRVKKMKTHDGENITKKEIEAVLRSMNQTAIFRTYFKLYGIRPEQYNVVRFIDEFAPTKKIKRVSWTLTEPNRHKKVRLYRVDSNWLAENWPVSYIVRYFRDELSRGLTPYTKRPFLCKTHLYFCSPVYGHGDYNKWRSVSIKGNERLCDTLIRLADKYFPVSK